MNAFIKSLLTIRTINKQIKKINISENNLILPGLFEKVYYDIEKGIQYELAKFLHNKYFNHVKTTVLLITKVHITYYLHKTL